jgi:hypothetical protein
MSLTGFTFFLRMNNIPVGVCVCAHYVFFIHSSTEGQLNCLDALAIVAMNREVQFSFQDIDFISSGYIPRSSIASFAILSLIIYFFALQGFEVRGSCLQGRHSIT